MTAQISDHIVYKGEIYNLTGFTEEIPFLVESFGLTPFGNNSACWRGFQRTFIIENNKLLIKDLDVNINKGDSRNSSLPNIYGIKPNTKVKKPKSLFFNTEYKNLNHKINYSGSVLIGKDFIRNLYVHMGFHPAWKFEKVIDLTFSDGVLTNSEDLSKKMTEIRGKFKDNENQMKKFNTSDWIESTFNQKYKK